MSRYPDHYYTSSLTTLGKLKRIDLREYWRHEALNFTRWLAESDNIALLSDEVGIDIKVIQTEASVGRFSVDILGEEENTSRKIIVENQLETTDHSHLGQLITYAAGLEAEFIIWIVQDVREEHRQAVDWLNEHTDEHINFFLVAIELWQIEDSRPAAKFAVISRPNEWKRSVRSSEHDTDLTDTKTKQLEFWQSLKEFVANNHPNLKLRTPRPQHWFNVAIGRSDCHVALTVMARENRVGCELYISDDKPLYRLFLANRNIIETELGIVEPIEWMELPSKKASRVRTYKECQFSNHESWESAFEWLTNSALRFKRVFAKDWRGDGILLANESLNLEYNSESDTNT